MIYNYIAAACACVQRSRFCRGVTWSGSSSARATASTRTGREPTAPRPRGTGRPRARTASSARAQQAPSSASRRRSSSTEAGHPEDTAPPGSCTSTVRPSPSSHKAKTVASCSTAYSTRTRRNPKPQTLPIHRPRRLRPSRRR